MSQQGLRFTLDVDGLAETATAVVSFTLYQSLSTPFLLRVDIASDQSDLTAPDFLEKSATLTVWQGTVAQRYLHGIITRVESGENNRWQMNYTLTLSPPLWRAGLRQNFRIFQQQDIQAISSTLLTENGVTDWVPSFYESHPAREFCVQYGETDLAFLTRLWAEEGIFYFDWLHPTGPEQKLVLCDDVAGVSTLGEMPFNRTTDVKVDHTETTGNNQSITIGLGQTVKVGKENAAGHDQTITVAHDRSITVRNDQTLKVKNDRTVSISHDDGLYVANDRKVTVEGKQEHKTSGDHISLVEGSHSLEVKGDLARKVSGALGIKVEGDIVLESSSKISLKVSCSFIVIHSAGVDIMGPKINPNSGGCPGVPVGTLQPVVLESLTNNEDIAPEQNDSEDKNNSGDNNDSEEQNEPKADDENRKIQIITNKLNILESHVVGLDFKIRNENNDTLIRSNTSQHNGESALYPEEMFSDANHLFIGKESDKWQVYVSVDDL